MSTTPPPAPSHPPPPKPKKHHAKPPPRPSPPPPHHPEGHGAEQSGPPPHHRNQPHHQQHPPANVTIVRTAEELQQATLRGAIDIEIRDHIDLSTLNLAFDPTGEFKGTVRMYGKSSLLYSYSPMRSIRVRPLSHCDTCRHTVAITAVAARRAVFSGIGMVIQ